MYKRYAISMAFDITPGEVNLIRYMITDWHVESRPYNIAARVAHISEDCPVGCLLMMLVDVVGQAGVVETAAVVEVVTRCMNDRVSEFMERMVEGTVSHVEEVG